LSCLISPTLVLPKISAINWDLSERDSSSNEDELHPRVDKDSRSISAGHYLCVLRDYPNLTTAINGMP